MEKHKAPRTAVVTGAASGLGAAVSDRLQADGYRVAGLDLNDSDVDIPIIVDVQDPSAVTEAVASAASHLGGIDAVAHCAGVVRNNLTPVHKYDEEEWHRTININLTGSFNVARAVLPYLIEARGALVLIASSSASHPQVGSVAYSASKAGVKSLAASIALEYAPLGIRACSVSPGYMETGMTERLLGHQNLRSRIEASIPVGRIADSAEVAEVVAFLLGHTAKFMTGQDVVVDGGSSITAYSFPEDVERMWKKHRGSAEGRTLR